jgi:hypothetical protein
VGINGARFWRGSNTGLQHSFIDTTVTNGKTYYYTVCSYSMGDTAFGTTGLQPTECSKIIRQDEAGNITFVDQNCAVVTPNAPVAGYVPPQIVGDFTKVTSGLGTGTLNVQVLDPKAILPGAQYKISYNSSGTIPSYQTSSYNIIRTYNGAIDTLQSRVDAKTFGKNTFSAPFDGMVFNFQNDTAVSVDYLSTGWYVGKSNLLLMVVPDNTSPSLDVKWPTNYEMQFYDHNIGVTPYNKIPVNYSIINLLTGDSVKSEIIDNDKSKTLTTGDDIVLIQPINNQVRYSWRIHYQPPFNPTVTPVNPQPGDKFRIYTKRPFYQNDYFSYTTKASTVNSSLANKNLSSISVVPNPYIATASWEQRTLYSTGRGTRKIDFINLPAKCTIRIYTVTGSLVKTLYNNQSDLYNGGAVSWDLVTEDGMDIAYGLYVYHVDAPGIGEHIGKFAVIK